MSAPAAERSLPVHLSYSAVSVFLVARTYRLFITLSRLGCRRTAIDICVVAAASSQRVGVTAPPTMTVMPVAVQGGLARSAVGDRQARPLSVVPNDRFISDFCAHWSSSQCALATSASRCFTSFESQLARGVGALEAMKESDVDVCETQL